MIDLKISFGVMAEDDDLDRACQCPGRIAKKLLGTSVPTFAMAPHPAEQIAELKSILPANRLAPPIWMFGFLMPIKQTAPLLPQMVVAGRIRQLAKA